MAERESMTRRRTWAVLSDEARKSWSSRNPIGDPWDPETRSSPRSIRRKRSAFSRSPKSIPNICMTRWRLSFGSSRTTYIEGSLYRRAPAWQKWRANRLFPPPAGPATRLTERAGKPPWTRRSNPSIPVGNRSDTSGPQDRAEVVTVHEGLASLARLFRGPREEPEGGRAPHRLGRDRQELLADVPEQGAEVFHPPGTPAVQDAGEQVLLQPVPILLQPGLELPIDSGPAEAAGLLED